jgi:hypothetical protein
MFLEEIINEIEDTLDNLIENMLFYNEEDLLIEEKVSFKKVQESLLAKLCFLDDKLQKQKESLKQTKLKKIDLSFKEKLEKFDKLKINQNLKSLDINKFKINS